MHTWFVINLKGEIHRIEFGKFRTKNSKQKIKIGIFRDFIKPTKGMNIFFWKKNPRFKSKLIDYIEGEEDPIARIMAGFIKNKSIKNKSDNYPLKKRYSLKGPNSNTYTQWVLDKFPKANLKLPNLCYLNIIT